MLSDICISKANFARNLFSVIIQSETNATIIDLRGLRLPGDKTTPETPLSQSKP